MAKVLTYFDPCAPYAIISTPNFMNATISPTSLYYLYIHHMGQGGFIFKCNLCSFVKIKCILIHPKYEFHESWKTFKNLFPLSIGCNHLVLILCSSGPFNSLFSKDPALSKPILNHHWHVIIFFHVDYFRNLAKLLLINTS
jgi:hypothetical protein